MVMPSNQGYAYQVVTEQDPGALSRVLEFFAMNSHVPHTLAAHRIDEEALQVDVTVPDLDYASARVIAAKMKQMVVVRNVRLFQAMRKSRANASGGVMELTEVLI